MVKVRAKVDLKIRISNPMISKASRITLRETIDIEELSKRALNPPVPGVTVRELLSISPGLI